MDFVTNVVLSVWNALRRFLGLTEKPSTTIALADSSAAKLALPGGKTEKPTASPSAEFTPLPPAVIQSDEVVRVVVPDEVLGPDEEAKLALLYPPFARQVRRFVLEARHRKMVVGVFCGLRTFEEQARLFAQGRTTPGSIVTRARPGHSFHNYGLAVDLVFDGNLVKSGWQWSWDDAFPWRELALLGRDEFGLEPAYFWTQFPEAPHYQATFGFRIEALKAMHIAGGMPAVWKMLDGVIEDHLFRKK